MLGLGIMSGSSMDGLDLALVDLKYEPTLKWELLEGRTFPINDALKDQLQRVTGADPFEFAEIEFSFSKFIVDCILSFRAIARAKEDFIGIHGHTVLHSPQLNRSVQMVNAAFLAEKCESPVVTDFRNNDMALGGQGTPMAVIADKYLFPGNDYYLNLGGIANISYFDNGWCAYDLFPFNQVLNYFSQKIGFEFDKDGELARSGDLDNTLIENLSKHPFILNPPSKSLDNTQVKQEWINSIEKTGLSPVAILRTFTEFTCLKLKDLIKPNSKIMITGGGVKNLFFLSRLKALLRDNSIDLIVPSDSIIDYKEAILMAFVGGLRIEKKTNFISEATGASRDTIGGAVYLPATYGKS